MNTRSYVLHTEAQKEHVAAVNAAGLGFEVLVPMHTVFHRRGGRMVPFKNTPLFPRYILVAFDIEADRARYPALNRMRGAAAFKPGSRMALLCATGDRPTPIPEEAMKIIMDRERARKASENGIEAVNPFKVGDPVVLTSGPFASFAGKIESLDGIDRVVALLELFGRQTPVKVDVDQVKAAS